MTTIQCPAPWLNISTGWGYLLIVTGTTGSCCLIDWCILFQSRKLKWRHGLRPCVPCDCDWKCCSEVGGGSTLAFSSGTPVSILPHTSAHLSSIWSLTSTVFKAWLALYSPLCSAVLHTATLQNDFLVQLLAVTSNLKPSVPVMFLSFASMFSYFNIHCNPPCAAFSKQKVHSTLHISPPKFQWKLGKEKRKSVSCFCSGKTKLTWPKHFFCFVFFHPY